MDSRVRTRLIMGKKITTKQLRDFGLLIGIGLPTIVGLILPFIMGHHLRVWTFWVGLPLLLLGFIRPSFLYFPYKFWMNIGIALGWLNSRIILSLIYILVLLPIAFFMRLFGYDPLKKIKKEAITYRENSQANQIDFTRIF